MKCLCCKETVPETRLKYCSDECMKAYTNFIAKQRRAKLKAKYYHCEVCGKSLTGRQSKYCSLTCKNKGTARLAKKRVMEEWRRKYEGEDRTE